jgi:hypothetical protein
LVSGVIEWFRSAARWILMLDLRARVTRWDQEAHWIGNIFLLALGMLVLVAGDGGWPVVAWLVLVVVLGRLSLRARVRQPRWRRWLFGDDE